MPSDAEFIRDAKDEALMDAFPFVRPLYYPPARKNGGGYFIEIRDAIPPGWWMAFGLRMLVEMRDALMKDGFDRMFFHGGIGWRVGNALLWLKSIFSKSAFDKYNKRTEYVLDRYRICKCKQICDSLAIYGCVFKFEGDSAEEPPATTSHLNKVLRSYAETSAFYCTVCGREAEYVSYNWPRSMCAECANEELKMGFGLSEDETLQERINVAQSAYMPIEKFVGDSSNGDMRKLLKMVVMDFIEDREQKLEKLRQELI